MQFREQHGRLSLAKAGLLKETRYSSTTMLITFSFARWSFWEHVSLYCRSSIWRIQTLLEQFRKNPQHSIFFRTYTLSFNIAAYTKIDITRCNRGGITSFASQQWRFARRTLFFFVTRVNSFVTANCYFFRSRRTDSTKKILWMYRSKTKW